MKSYLEIRSLNQKLGGRHIVKDVSLFIKPGEVVALLGPNGAGKTTLLRTTIGLLPTPKADLKNHRNEIFIEDELINRWPVHKRIESGLVYLPQHPALFQSLSVLDNLRLVFEYHKDWQGKEWSSFEKEVKEWFKQTDLTTPFDQMAGSLSGGQKRKLEVIRSVLMRPKVLLFDEPFAGVDPKSIYELKNIFVDMAKKGIAVLISDHNVDQLLSIATRVYVLLDGRVVTSGGIKDILDDSCTRESYLGDQFYAEVVKKFI
jgi:lipopolysaccharide export system ATP-binding protein